MRKGTRTDDRNVSKRMTRTKKYGREKKKTRKQESKKEEKI